MFIPRKEFDSINAFENQINSYMPCVYSSLPLSLLEFNVNNLLEKDCSIDFTCIEKSTINETNIFRGNAEDREKVSIRLSAFTEAFLNRKENINHWIHDLDFSVYLSQATVYSASVDDLTDLVIPDVFSSDMILPIIPKDKLHHINLWMNIDEVYGNLHFDSYHNVLFVHEGEKEVTLISPERFNNYMEANNAYNLVKPCYSSTCNHSSISHDELSILIDQGYANVSIIQAGECVFK